MPENAAEPPICTDSITGIGTVTAEFRAKHYLIDRMDERPAVNELRCGCGVRIWPDCDVSSVSISESFVDHLVDEGATREDIDAWLDLMRNTSPV